MIQDALRDWIRLSWSDLHFDETWTAVLVLVILLAISGLMLLARGLRSQKAGPHARDAACPAPADPPLALLGVPARGLPGFPAGRAVFRRRARRPAHGLHARGDVVPGRRIALLVDGSSSMVMKFETKTLKTPENRAFYTAVAAAEHFMKLRMNGRYHDLIALIQFGNEAYVVTPFTTDYDNILLSIRLISSPKEWGNFNDWGTTIIQGLNQATALFKAFDFVNASGNAMVLFTDGRDEEKNIKGKPIESVIDGHEEVQDPGVHDAHRVRPERRPDPDRQAVEAARRTHRRALLRGRQRGRDPAAPRPRSTSSRPAASTSANTRPSGRASTATRSSPSCCGSRPA